MHSFIYGRPADAPDAVAWRPSRLEVQTALDEIELLPEVPDAAAQCMEERSMTKLRDPDADLAQSIRPLPEGRGIIVPVRGIAGQETANALIEGLCFRPFFMRQIVAVPEQDQVLEDDRPADGRKRRQPLAQGRQIRCPRIPHPIGSRELGERAERNVVQGEFVVGIAEQPRHHTAQFRRPSRVRSAKEPAAVVIVRVKIVPDERLPKKNVLQFLDVGY
jgi:hypothetical protein